MGILNDIKGIKEIQKIKNGKIGNLSISQITALITNMKDAKNNLTAEEFNQVYKLFLELRKCNTKLKMNIDSYCKTAIDIIKKFDEIAPYQKYSGGNELEFSFFMDDIHQESYDELSKEDINCIKYIVSNSKGMIEEIDAKDFIEVLHTYTMFGKDEAIKNFENIAEIIINRSDPIKCISKISFLTGILNSNGIINVDEMNYLCEKYQNEILEIIMKKK